MGEKVIKCKKCGGEAEKIGQEPSKGSMLGKASSLITALGNPAEGLLMYNIAETNEVDVYRCRNKECGYEWKE